MEKSATTGQPQGSHAGNGYHYQTMAGNGMNDPYAAYRPGAGTQAAANAKPRWGEFENPWADIGMSMIPGVGSIYMGNKAYNDFSRGNWGSGLGNLAMAGLSIIPGVGAVRGLVGAGKIGANGLMKGKALAGASKAHQAGAAAANKGGGSLSSAWAGSNAATPGGWKGGLAMGGGAMAMPMLDPKVAPEPINPNAGGGSGQLHEQMARTMAGYGPQ